jgi:hypothetical protein
MEVPHCLFREKYLGFPEKVKFSKKIHRKDENYWQKAI